MTLFNIAVKNIKRNFYNYFLYFISMVISIMIYYTFNTIRYNEQILRLAQGDQKIVIAFKSSAIVVAVFSAIFIWYSNSFFTKRRKKEIGMYSLMGIKKKEIARMLFYENILMGLLALVCGIFIGSLFSKLFVMLLVNLMGYNIAVEFSIMPMAVFDTLFTFAVLFLITSIYGYTIIYRFELIELFRAEKTGEKEPRASLLVAALSIIFIGFGYWFYLNGMDITGNFLIIILGTLTFTIIGTYLLFSSFVVFAVKVSKKNKKRYYKGINLIGTSQLLYRIKSHSRTLATIAVLSASTLTALAVLISTNYDINKKMDRNFPFTYSYFTSDKNTDKKVKELIRKYPQNKLINYIESDILKLEGQFPKRDKSQPSTEEMYIISEYSYNKTAQVRGLQKIKFSTSDEVIVFDEKFNKTFSKSYKGKDIIIKYSDKSKKLKIIDSKDYPLYNELMLPRMIVIENNLYKELYKFGKIYKIRGYVTDNKKDSKKLTSDIREIIEKEDLRDIPYSSGYTSYYSNYEDTVTSSGKVYTSYYENYVEIMKFSGLTIFIGAFLGIVFLTATGSIIFFKQLSEANEDKGRYKILKNIGVNKREIKYSISKQMVVIFLLPLVVGIIHSCVAITLFARIINLNLTVPFMITIGSYTAIYFIYYLITVNTYSKIVNSI